MIRLNSLNIEIDSERRGASLSRFASMNRDIYRGANEYSYRVNYRRPQSSVQRPMLQREATGMWLPLLRNQSRRRSGPDPAVHPRDRDQLRPSSDNTQRRKAEAQRFT